MDVTQEKRSATRSAVPENALSMLTDSQKVALRRIENFGWQLKFIRQPSFEPPLVVVESSTGVNIGVLDEDGGVNMNPQIILRN